MATGVFNFKAFWLNLKWSGLCLQWSLANRKLSRIFVIMIWTQDQGGQARPVSNQGVSHHFVQNHSLQPSICREWPSPGWVPVFLHSGTKCSFVCSFVNTVIKNINCSKVEVRFLLVLDLQRFVFYLDKLAQPLFFANARLFPRCRHVPIPHKLKILRLRALKTWESVFIFLCVSISLKLWHWFQELLSAS